MKCTLSLLTTIPWCLACNGGREWRQRSPDIVGSLPATESGVAIALNKDGSTISIEEYGCHNSPYIVNGTGTGRLRVLTWSEEHQWMEQGKFFQGLSVNVDMSGDANTIATTGFIIEESNSNQDFLTTVYRRINGEDTEWESTKNFTVQSLGYSPGTQSLSRDGTTLAITGPLVVSNNVFRDVFRFSDGKWEKMAPTVEMKNEMGLNLVSLSHDGNTMACLKSNADTLSIAVRVFNYVEDDWKQRGETIQLQAPSVWGAVLTQLKLSDNGEVVAIGAPNQDVEEEAIVQVYGFSSANEWIARGPKLEGKGAFGAAIDLDETGSTLVVGDTLDDIVQVYRYDSKSDAYVGEATLDGPELSGFGGSVAVSSDGMVVAGGGSYFQEFTGVVRVFELSDVSSSGEQQ